MAWLDAGPWLNLEFLLLALAIIFVSIFLYFRGRRIKVPVFHAKSFGLIGGRLRTLTAVEISYRGQPEKDLTLTRVALRNRGRDPINRNDIAPKDQLPSSVAGGRARFGGKFGFLDESDKQPVYGSIW